MKTHSVLFLLFLSLFSFELIFPTFAQEKSKRKKTSVIVMPFYINYNINFYPFWTDQIREALIIGLYRRGFDVVEDDSSWSNVFKFDYQLANLSTEMADSISTSLGVDLIVFGWLSNSAKVRNGGFYSFLYSPNPILIKVFDSKKKSIILYERLDFVQRWGLFETNLSIYDFGFKIATKISDLGY